MHTVPVASKPIIVANYIISLGHNIGAVSKNFIYRRNYYKSKHRHRLVN